MKVAFVQTSPEFGEIEKNVDKAVGRIRSLGAGLVVLPELFSTGYQFRSKKELGELAEDPVEGYAGRSLARAARERKMFIVAGFAERSGGKLYNSAMLVGPRGLVGVYRKAHLFWEEKRLFSPGDTPFRVYDIGQARVGMMICFDWLFPEVARELARKGADIICHPSNLVLPHCPQAMITRSLENRVFTITANRVGSEERVEGTRLRFIGKSQVTAPDGKVLLRAQGRSTAAGAVEIEPKEAREKFITPRNNVIRDLRTDLLRG
ncbi:MAG: nitrilase-related carbon-nitrogen hydrolase [Deltaproteobacteria bacterium]|nr:nitrilase-related carbon-nitrogen hydrolase [Deltaproteobacteria bacterium]